jgi:predicted membrane protein
MGYIYLGSLHTLVAQFLFFSMGFKIVVNLSWIWISFFLFIFFFASIHEDLICVLEFSKNKSRCQEKTRHTHGLTRNL